MSGKAAGDDRPRCGARLTPCGRDGEVRKFAPSRWAILVAAMLAPAACGPGETPAISEARSSGDALVLGGRLLEAMRARGEPVGHWGDELDELVAWSATAWRNAPDSQREAVVRRLTELDPDLVFAGTDGAGAMKVRQRSSGIEFVFIPGGVFMAGEVQGGSVLADQQPHRTRLGSFLIARDKVSAGAANHIDPVAGSPKDPPGADAVVLPDDEAERMCRQLGASLPTEAQWEYVSRGCPTLRGTAPPRAAVPGRQDDPPWIPGAPGATSERWGVRAMFEGPREWCADLYGAIGPEDVVDPAARGARSDESTSFGLGERVVRGGASQRPAAWGASAAWSVRLPGKSTGSRSAAVRPVIDLLDLLNHSAVRSERPR